MLKLIAYKTEKGLYYANSKVKYRGREELNYSYKVEGEVPVKSEYKSDWYFLEGKDELISITTTKSGGYGKAHWELRDKSTKVEGVIPETLTCEEADEFEDDYDWFIGSESKYYAYRGLYKRVRENLPPVTEEVEFEIEYKGEIKHELVENNYKDMKIKVLKDDEWGGEDEEEIDLSHIVHYYELEELLTPDLVLHNRPCYIPADTTYRIVRNYIKQNIDYRYANITSDYDFCFKVTKVIHIKPYTKTTEYKKSNGKSYAKPRFSHQTISTKSVEIFEMCPSKPYQKYTPIEGFKGSNLADLIENIQLYLKELIEVINQPLKECEECGGTGCTFSKVENINNRG